MIVPVKDAKGIFRVNGEALNLTRTEKRFLDLLYEAKGMILTSRMVLDALYPNGAEPELKILDVFACKIRGKIDREATPTESIIRTVWGRGYAFGKPAARPVLIPVINDPQTGQPKVGRYGSESVTLADLPRESEKLRWLPRRKLVVVQITRSGLATEAQIFGQYPDLSSGELGEWKALIDQHGAQGLRTTRTQSYTSAGGSAADAMA